MLKRFHEEHWEGKFKKWVLTKHFWSRVNADLCGGGGRGGRIEQLVWKGWVWGQDAWWEWRERWTYGEGKGVSYKITMFPMHTASLSREGEWKGVQGHKPITSICLFNSIIYFICMQFHMNSGFTHTCSYTLVLIT